jgi:hypothetical protein
MEKKIAGKMDQHITGIFKDIKEFLGKENVSDETIDQMNLLFESRLKLALNKDDFHKRKRTQNIVPTFSRCCAKRGNGEQCSRKKKDDGKYCGTHLKGSPYGLYEKSENVASSTKVEVWAQNIKGIIYYVDKQNNVYLTEDIVNNKFNPAIIAKYTKEGETYHIPEFGI